MRPIRYKRICDAVGLLAQIRWFLEENAEIMNALPSGSGGILVVIWALAQIQLFLHELAQIDTFRGPYRALLAFGANLVVSRGNAPVYAFRGISLALT